MEIEKEAWLSSKKAWLRRRGYWKGDLKLRKRRDCLVSWPGYRKEGVFVLSNEHKHLNKIYMQSSWVLTQVFLTFKSCRKNECSDFPFMSVSINLHIQFKKQSTSNTSANLTLAPTSKSLTCLWIKFHLLFSITHWNWKGIRLSHWEIIKIAINRFSFTTLFLRFLRAFASFTIRRNNIFYVINVLSWFQ